MTAAPLLGDVGFVGTGALGSVLARAMHGGDYAVRAVASRTPASAERLAGEIPGCAAVTAQEAVDSCDTIFLTVPDDSIADVAATLRWHECRHVVHCSGAVPLNALAPAAERGAVIGAMHPLQTFSAGVDPAAALRGIAYAIEAQPPLREALERLATRLGGWLLPLASEDRALYHAGAIAACGLVTTLLKGACDLWEGVPGLKGQGLRALLPLTRSALDSIERQGLPSALTGPAARGDTGVVRMHLDALAASAPGFRPLYAALSLAMLPIAREKGTLGEPEEARLRAMLTAAAAESNVEGASCA